MSDKLAALYPHHLATVKARHDKALAESRFERVAIFAGAQHLIFLDDMNYPFKVNPHFKSWVPVVDNPNCFLVYEPGSKPKVVFHQPVDYWHKPAATPVGHWVGEVEIEMIASPEDAKRFVPPNGRTAFIGEWDASFESWGFAEANPKKLIDRLHWERSWKTDYEIECVRLANIRGARGHRAAEKSFRDGASEYEIHIEYLCAAGHTEDELPYGNIIALNENAAVLHYYHHDRDRRDASRRHSFLIDAGASVNGYASDITRTYSRVNDEFQELVDAMDAAQQEICAAVKPGVDYRDIHLLAHRKIAEVLERFKLVALDAGAIVEKKISSTFLPHGVGHFLGLQVHDVAGFMADPGGTTIPKPEGHPYLRITRKIEPRMLFTIEPGLYFIEPLLAALKKSDEARHVNWPKIDSFRKFGGIRIEDNLIVGNDGAQNLTRAAFKEVA